MTSIESDLRSVVARVWGYDGFRPKQLEAMRAVVEGEDSVVVLPTGGGKSLCYQAPALITDGLAVVVSPLIALMKDQVDALRGLGVSAAAIHSAQPPDERRAVAERLRSGALRLLYVSPERLVGDGSARFRERLLGSRLAYVAIDEAHCISHWGHDFRPEYRRLGMLKDELPGVPMHAFTATATPRVRADIARELRLEDPTVVVGPFDRPNLLYRVRRRSGVRAQLEALLARHPGEAGIVYCITRREVERVTEQLEASGCRAVRYHAGLSDEERHRNQDAFLNEDAEVVVATVAFGMGIDRPDVRFVAHAGCPRSLEHYQQESGRAGRDGLPAECLLLYSPADFATWERLVAGTAGEEAALHHLAEIRRYAFHLGCRHRALVTHFGQTYEGGNCGACDVCLGELEAVEDATVVAQKVLSCVIRVGESYGVGHVVDVLRGKDGGRIAQLGHDELSTHGLLADVGAAEVRGYVEQLLASGCLEQVGDQYPVLAVTEAGWRVLRSEDECELYRQPRPPARRRGRADDAGWEGVDRALFERLRALRREIASERGVPPYVVFHDRSLRDMARLAPTTVAGLTRVYGVGERKAADLGDAFVAEIVAHLEG